MNGIPMVSRDYTKEIGMKSGEVIVPMPYAVVILAALSIAGWLGVSALYSSQVAERAFGASSKASQVVANK